MAAETFPRHTVKIADAPALPDDESWVLSPHLICLSLIEGLAPTVSEATLLWRFGVMKREVGFADEDEQALNDQASAYVAPLDLRGKYVLVECDALGIQWFGYVAVEGLVRWGEQLSDPDDEDSDLRLIGGDQQFTAYGLEWFLARQQVAGPTSFAADRNKRPIDFNAGSGAGRDIDGARRANRAAEGGLYGSPPFDELTVYDFDHSEDAELWSALDAVIAMTVFQTPRNKDGATRPVFYAIAPDAAPFLDWYYPTTRGIEGRSVLEVIDQLIDRRRGLVCWWRTEVIDLDGEDTLFCLLHVSSTAASPLALPDAATLPANANVVDFDPSAHNMLQPVQIIRGKRTYDRIRVRGALRTTTFSAHNTPPGVGPLADPYAYPFAEPINSRIEQAWSDDDETAYLAAASGTAGYGDLEDKEKKDLNDRLRKTPRFERVYQYFAIWTETGAGYELSPMIVQATGSIAADIPTERRNLRLQQITPLRVGYDYADVTNPTPAGDPQYGEEFLRPFALVYLPTGCGILPKTLGDVLDYGEINGDGGWRPADTLSTQPEFGHWAADIEGPALEAFRFKGSFHFHALAGDSGFRLSPAGPIMAHYLASSHGISGVDANQLTDIGGEPSRYPIGVNGARGLLVTCTVEWDAYCEGIYPEAALDAEPIQELLIQVSDRVRFDWVAKGTVYGVAVDGMLKQVTTAGAVRDDRKLCETIAKLAYQWYSSERAQLNLSFANLVAPLNVGDLVEHVGTLEAAATVNSVVSQIRHDFERGATQISCGFQELDFDNII